MVTHYLEEAEQCNRLGFMVAGEIIAAWIAEASEGEHEGQPCPRSKRISPIGPLRTLKKKFGASRVSLFGDRLHLVTENEEQKQRAADRVWRRPASKCCRRNPVPFSLEDVFISLIESRRSEIPL